MDDIWNISVFTVILKTILFLGGQSWRLWIYLNQGLNIAIVESVKKQ